MNYLIINTAKFVFQVHQSCWNILKIQKKQKRFFFEDEEGKKWLHTGDLGYINEKGELVITGRLKRIFVCGVNKVYPPEMENLIMNFPEVRKCVVTGVSDPELRTVLRFI